MKNFEICTTFNEGTITLECTANCIQLTMQTDNGNERKCAIMELTFDELADFNSLIFIFKDKANRIVNKAPLIADED